MVGLDDLFVREVSAQSRWHGNPPGLGGRAVEAAKHNGLPELTDLERDSDRAEADKVLRLVGPFLRAE